MSVAGDDGVGAIVDEPGLGDARRADSTPTESTPTELAADGAPAPTTGAATGAALPPGRMMATSSVAAPQRTAASTARIATVLRRGPLMSDVLRAVVMA